MVDGEILAAAQEERFSRKKHDPDFPREAVKYCLAEAGCDLSDLDAIAFYDKPLLKFERLLETYYSFAPRGVKSFITAMPVWLKEKMFLKRLIHQELEEIGNYDKKTAKLLFPEHHLSHAASAFYPSPFDEAAVVTIDGVGEWATASICKGSGKDITVLKELHFPHSLGLLYSAFTYYLGFRVNSGEYKLMGLAPYGNPKSEQVAEFKKIIKEKLIKIYDDGSVWLNQDYFNYATGLEMTFNDKWEEIFGVARRDAESEMEQVHCNMALAIQDVTEEIVCKLAATAKELTGSNNLCLAGGVALNCVANGVLQRKQIFGNIYIQPAAGDAGGSLGAALAAHYIFFDQTRDPQSNSEPMKGAYLGPDFSEIDVIRLGRRYKASYTRFSSDEERSAKTAQWLSRGDIVGWIQGRMEFGPRALGNRSILGDPRDREMQKKLNLKIKYRETFRPFAPSVLAEHAEEYFDLESSSAYMLLVAPLREPFRNKLPKGYHELDLRTKLYTERSELPAITHVDFSARIQTVHRETNPAYHNLITAFKDLTGVPILVNTSFNVRGEPIVCTPEDAYRCFMRTDMDKLVIGDFYFEKEDQPK